MTRPGYRWIFFGVPASHGGMEARRKNGVESEAACGRALDHYGNAIEILMLRG